MASVTELSGKYSAQLSQLRAIFPSWDEADLAYTLQDARGNVDEAAMAISEGRASQFTQATNRKKPVKAAKESAPRHSNRNADTGGWESTNGGGAIGDGDFKGGRGGRGGARGARGGRGGRGGEPFRGGRGGRGGLRGGRGGYTNGASGDAAGANGTKSDLTTTATTSDGWATQVEQATKADAGGDDGGWGEDAPKVEDAAVAPEAEAAVPVPALNEDFAAAGGLSDAPAAKEIKGAAEAVKAGQAASVKPKMTWAQIAKPQEKPKPVPPPAPVAQPKPAAPPAAVEAVESAAEPEEPAAASNEPEVEQAEAESAEQEPEEVTDFLPEEPVTTQPPVEDEPAIAGAEAGAEEDDWSSDPAIAGSGAQPAWAASSPVAQASAPTPAASQPEPVTTYTGPPGFNNLPSSISKPAPPSSTTAAAPTAIPQAPLAQRTNSRAANRFKNAEGQGVVLPPALDRGHSSLEMQFGSLSFGGLNGDGVEAPIPISPIETKSEFAPAPAAPAVPQQQPAQQVTSPVRQPVAAPPASQQAQAPAQSPYYSHQAQAQAAQQQQQQPPATSAYPSQTNQQTLQAQMAAYQSQYAQPQPPQAQPQPPQQQQQQEPQGFGGFRGFDQYASLPQPTQQQLQPQQEQQQHAQTQSAYDAGAGAFGGAFGGSHLFGQQQQQQQQAQAQGQGQAQQAQQGNEYSQRSYDSYGVGGYARPPIEEPKQANAAQSHTPTAPAPSQIPHQGAYYSNMGYYQNAPYNPYYQYGQAPTPTFQQYYPLGQRQMYGQPPAPAQSQGQGQPQGQGAPQSQAQPSPAHVQAQPNKAAQQPQHQQHAYGAASSYPSAGGYDDFSLGRFGGGADKPTSAQGFGGYGSAQQQQPTNANGNPNAYGAAAWGAPRGQTASAPNNNNDDNASGYKGIGTGANAIPAAGGARPGQAPAQGQQLSQQQQQQQQAQAQQQAQQQQQQQAQAQYGGYGGYGAYGAGNEGWGQYGYGGARNGYAGWQH